MKNLKNFSSVVAVCFALALGGCFAKGLSRTHASPPKVDVPGSPALYDFAGAMHIHSLFSHDSCGTLEEILQGGRDCGCDFLVVTDHDDLGLKSEEGFHGEMLLIVGCELSTPDGHVLALDIDRVPERLAVERMLKDVGFSAVAHPCRKKKPWKGGEDGFQGVEVLNLGTAFHDADKGKLSLQVLFTYPFSRRGIAARFVPRPQRELALYDKISLERHIVLLAGVDAHMPPVVGTFVNLYSHLFAIARIHVLAPALDAAEIIGAIERGRTYAAMDILEDATGFVYYADLEQTVLMGGEAAFRPGIRLVGRAPVEGRFVLYRNGVPVLSRDGREFQYCPKGPGVFRLEVYLKYGNGPWFPWIYSNPIWLTD